MKTVFQKILVPVDGSHSCLRAEQLAASIAKSFKSEVNVVHIVSHDFMHPELKANYQLPPLVLQKLEESYMKAGEKIIQTAKEIFKEEGIIIKTELLTHEDPADKILQMVKDEKYDLVVIGNRADTPVKQYSLGSIAEKIALYAQCSVLIAKRKTQIKKLLVAIDGSEQSGKALDYAIELAHHFKGKITLLHVKEAKLFEMEPKVIEEVSANILNDAAAKIKSIPYDKRLEIGDPAKTILDLAKEENYNVIVLGSRGLSSVKRFLLGSVSADVSMDAHRSVLIVK
jgi:nucleotide-binding universal stress UspA family protein